MIAQGMRCKEVCEKLNISKSSYYLWKKGLYQVKEKAGHKKITYDMYRRLVDDCNKYKVQIEILQQCKCKDMTIAEKEKMVESLEYKYKVSDLCAALDLNPATYYNYKFRRIREPEVITHHDKIKEAFIEAYIETKGRLGSEKMVAYLRKKGVRTSQRKITQLMKETGMLNNQMKKKSQIRQRNKYGSELNMNYLNRQFDQPEPNIYWASDVTEIKTSSGKYYLIIVMDLFARKIISWDISRRQNVEFLLKCFNTALQNRNHPKLMGFHSDQGAIYKSYEFRKTLENKNIQQSFSMKGNPYDNSVVEGFFSRLKKEECNKNKYSGYEDLYDSLYEYMNFYNKDRPHSSLDWLTPDEMEEKYYLELSN